MASSPPLGPNSVFVDASVLFAAALSGAGFARDVMMAGARGDLVLVFSSFVIVETQRNLAAKAPRALPFFDALLDSEVLQIIDPPAALVHRAARDIEPKDAPIVAGAVHAGVRFLATYDRKHLLANADLIRARFELVVGTPEAILASI